MTQEIRYKLLRNGVEYGELFASGSAPTLRASSSGEIKMSLQGTFLPDAYDSNGKKVEVDWLSDEIKPELIVDGVASSLCVLMPSTVTPKEEKGSTTLSIQAYDRCWRVKDTKVEGAIHLSAGTLYIAAVESLLISAGIATVIKTSSSAAITEDREDWRTGDSYLKIVNDLLSEINYKQLWFDADGFARLEPASVPDVDKIKHVFTNNKKDVRNPKEVEMISVRPIITKQSDIFKAPNVFICVCSNADKSSSMVAKAVNNNPQSPLSVMRRGRRIVEVVTVDNIASQDELQNYANRLLTESMKTGEVITLETSLLPGFGIGDISALKYDDTIGLYVERAWNMTLSPGGKMSHELERVVINLV